MKKFSSFKENVISKLEMKFINGGAWDHSYICDCGGNGFIGSGDLNQFRDDVRSSCSPGDPVHCAFDI